MMVYFLQSVRDGVVKIGVTRNLPKRIKMLSVKTKCSLNLINQIDGGDYSVEREAHRHFSDFHIGHEWYKFHESMTTYISPVVPFLNMELTGDLAFLRDALAPLDGNRGELERRIWAQDKKLFAGGKVYRWLCDKRVPNKYRAAIQRVIDDTKREAAA